MRAALRLAVAVVLLTARAAAAKIECPGTYTDALLTSYRVTHAAGGSEARVCFNVTARAECGQNGEASTTSCLASITPRPKFLGLVLTDTDPACAAKKQGKLKVKWSINGRGRKARGDGASSVGVNLSKLPIDGGTVCVDFSAGTNPSCKSILNLCKGGVCSYKLITKALKLGGTTVHDPVCVSAATPVPVGICAGVTCPPAGECARWRACNPDTGACDVTDPKPDGGSCTGGVCQGGACVASDLCANATCDPTNECQTGGPTVCDPTTGGCLFQDKPDGSLCSQGSCQGGVCTNFCTGVTCPPHGECQWGAGKCENATGICRYGGVANGAACSFGTCLWGSCTEVVTFDDLPPGPFGAPPQAPYRRLLWENARAAPAAQYASGPCPGGFPRAAASAPNLALNDQGFPLVVTAASPGATITLRSLVVTAGWRDGLAVTIRPIAPDGRERAPAVVAAGVAAPAAVDLMGNVNFQRILGFSVEASGGAPACGGLDPALDAPFFALDNLVVSHH